MRLARSYRFNLMVVALLLVVVACYCQLNPAPRRESPAEASFSQDLESVLRELGVLGEVCFALETPYRPSGGLSLVYTMPRWPKAELASALFRVSRYVAGQDRGVNLEGVRLLNSSSGESVDMSVSGLAAHTSQAPSSLRVEEMDLSKRLQEKAQGQLDQLLGRGAALALVDCECLQGWSSVGIPTYRIKTMRVSLLMARLPSPEFFEDKEADKVAAMIKAALGLDEGRGDQLTVVRLPELRRQHGLDCERSAPGLK